MPIQKIYNLRRGVKEAKKQIEKLIKEKEWPIIIGVTGGSCSGKGYIAQIIRKAVKGKILSMDDYYIGIKKMKNKNFDCLDAVDLKLLKEHLKLLKRGKRIKKPVYNFVNHSRVGQENYFPGQIIILEGLFVLNKTLREEIDFKIFVKASEKIQLESRIARDVKERGRTKEDIIQQWKETVRPMCEKYVKPQEKYADLVILNNKRR